MHLEQALAENTAVMKDLIVVLKESNEGRTAALAAAAAMQGQEATKRTRGPNKVADPAPSGAPVESSATQPTVTSTITAAPAVPTVEEVRALFGEYMSVNDEAEREKRKAFIVKVLAKVGAARATEIVDDKRAEAIALVKTKIGGADPFAVAAPVKQPEDDLLG